VAAALGTEEEFARHVADELAHATNAEARVGVALRYAPVFAARFDNPEAPRRCSGRLTTRVPPRP